MKKEWLAYLIIALGLLAFAPLVRARQFDFNLFTEGNGMENNAPANWFSDRAVDLVKAEEGLKLTAYRDAGGWSIGYGHYMGAQPVHDRITQEQAEDFLAADMSDAASLINSHVSVPLNQNQFDALTSFIYNLGSRALRGKDGEATTWLTMLNGGDYEGAAAQLSRWVHSEGRVNPVLAARRERERQLFMTA